MSREFDQLCEHDGLFIIYAGSEISEAAGLPSRAKLLASLLDEADARLPERVTVDLADLADDEDVADHELFAALERELTAPIYGRAIERMLDDRGKATPPLAQAIAELEPRLRGVVTPNIDHVLERAFMGMLDVHTQAVGDLASRKGWMYKIHGTLRNRSTWVFTSDQLRGALYRDALQRALFQSLFLAHTIVFVGTRLDDPVFRDIIDQITTLAQGQPPEHWMFVEASMAKPGRRRRLAKAGIQLIGYDNEDGQHDGCVRMLQELAGVEVEEPPPVRRPARAPRSARSASSTTARKPEQSGRQRPTATAQTRAETLSILFVAANPAGTDPLRLAREERIIREAIALSPNGEHLHLDTCPAANFDDLRRALLRKPYEIVHISGHSEKQGLILENALGDFIQISPRGLAGVFASYAPPEGILRCVVLNACYSISTGEVLSMNVPYTVAMNGPVSDRGALEFSRGFYDALGAGCDIPRAYREGQTCVGALTPRARFDSALLEVEA